MVIVTRICGEVEVGADQRCVESFEPWKGPGGLSFYSFPWWKSFIFVDVSPAGLGLSTDYQTPPANRIPVNVAL